MRRKINWMPPGADTVVACLLFGVLMLVLLLDCFSFFDNLRYEYQSLYGNGTFVAIDLWPYLSVLLNERFEAVPYILLFCIILTVWNYMYFYRKTKSVYLMKRIPDKTEMYRCCLRLPILFLVITAVVCLVFLWLALSAYERWTPLSLRSEEIYRKIDWWRLMI